MDLPQSRPGWFRFSRIGVLLLALGGLAGGAWKFQSFLVDPDVFLMFRQGEAEWIRGAVPFHMGRRKLGERTAVFRTVFEVESVPENAVLDYRAFRAAAVYLDGEQLSGGEGTQSDADGSPVAHADSSPGEPPLPDSSSDSSPPNPELTAWKRLRQVDLKPGLAPGKHVLELEVSNQDGHPMVLAHCEALGVRTGTHWMCRRGRHSTQVAEKEWEQAFSAHELNHPAPLSRYFPPSHRALLSRWFVYVPIFLGIFFWTFRSGDKMGWLLRLVLSARTMRFGLMGAWGLLCANNLEKLPLNVGFDVLGHVQYIDYIAKNHRLPLAPEGWETFQAPLYYIVAAAPYSLFTKFFELDTTVTLLRILSMLCGAAQVELVYRALRFVYGDREDLQSLGLAVGGLLPMNVYLSQTVSNEPFHGLLSSIVIVVVLRMLHRSTDRVPRRTIALLGVLLGLALLSKATAVLLVLPVVLAVVWAVWKTAAGVGRWFLSPARAVAIVLGLAFAVSSWYYLRNWIELGKFLTVGWDPDLGMVWWQDPGYRTLGHVTNFGVSLDYPINAGIVSFWDAIYSTLWTDGLLSSMIDPAALPPWNYSFMLSGSWLAVLPSAAILIGVIVSFLRALNPARRGLLFGALCLVIYLGAMLYLFVSLPFSCTGKASYTVGLTPCYAILAACGFENLIGNRFGRAFVNGGIGCWVVSVFCAYFIV